MKTIKDQLNAGQVDEVIADLKPHCRQSEKVMTCIGYREANKNRMRCYFCRKRGLPIGSGVVESACKQIVGKCCFMDNRWPDFLDWRACLAAVA